MTASKSQKQIPHDIARKIGEANSLYAEKQFT